MHNQNKKNSPSLTSVQCHLQLANDYLLESNAKLAAAQIQKARYLLEQLNKSKIHS